MEKETVKTGKKREINGVVVGNKMEKTVKVRVDFVEAHPVYKKVIKRKKVYFAHTESDLEVGDTVTIRESRPYSKKVRWVVVNKEK
jgi:small subunit ribosomal protein S17